LVPVLLCWIPLINVQLDHQQTAIAATRTCLRTDIAMARVALLTSVACFATLPRPYIAQDNATQCRNLMQISAKGRGQSQASGLNEAVEVDASLQAMDLRNAVPLQDILWTTNVGKPGSDCPGSDFYQKTGKITGSELSLKKGLVLKKGKCSGSGDEPNDFSAPLLTKEVSCNGATGCHPWCSPVFTSDRDTKNWTRMDELCKSWDGTPVTNDPECKSRSKIFSYIRTKVPEDKNRMYMKFAIPETTMCRHWCSLLWVTLYDTEDYGKSYRWCFGHQGDWGGCDEKEDIEVEEFTEHTFKLYKFSVKHLYKPEELKVELAIWNEFLSSELLIQNITFYHKDQPAPEAGEKTKCGNVDRCDEGMKCCRDETGAKGNCCPETSSCVEEMCCPSYYIQNPDLEGEARCQAPPPAPDQETKNITICR